MLMADKIVKAKRYLKLYFYFFKASLIREGQFRFNFYLTSLTNFLWGLVYLILYKFIFGYITEVGGWHYENLLVLAATFLLVNSLAKAFFELNFTKFAYRIYYGDLDLILTKPLSSQFYISLREFSFRPFLRFLMACGVLIMVISNNQIKIGLSNIILFLFLIILSLILIYSLWFLTLTLVFWLGNVENIYELFHPFLRFTVIPLDILPKFLKSFFFFIFPLIFITTIPVKTLFGLISWPAIIYGIFISFFLLFLSHKLWNFALKHYSSASS